jgi:hypothetical protein
MTAPKDQTIQISNTLLKKVEELLYNEYNGNIKEYRKALDSLRTSQNNLNMKYGNAFLTPFPTSDINKEELALDIVERKNRKE